MKSFSRLKIRTRIISAFAAVGFLTLLMGIYSIINMHGIDTAYTDDLNYGLQKLGALSTVRTEFTSLRMNTRGAWQFLGDEKGLDTQQQAAKDLYSSIDSELDDYLKVLTAHNASKDEISQITTLKTQLKAYLDKSLETIDSARSGVLAVYQDQFTAMSNDSSIEGVNTAIDNLYDTSQSSLLASSADNTVTANGTIFFSVIILLIVVVLCLLISVILVKSINNPLKKLMTSSKKVAKGDFDINLHTNGRDELSALSNEIGDMVGVLKEMVTDLNVMASEQSSGHLDRFVDATKYDGGYKDVVEGVNGLMHGVIDENLEMMQIIRAYSIGDFSKSMRKLPNDKAVISDGLDLLRKNLMEISGDINKLVTSAVAGNLDNSIEASKYTNDWNGLAVSLNSFMEAVAAPTKEVSAILYQISLGNLNVEMSGEYRGEFLALKNTVDKTVKDLNGYINDISRVLGELSNDNYDVDVSINYLGDFSPIKQGLNVIIDRINYVMSDINSSADQVAAGARQISESSMSLSQGATEQASAVEQLNATIESIADKTNINAKTAAKANDVATSSRKNAEDGNQDMKNMLLAMDEISAASKDISKIIKVIDEIAFQTNLLALNAAVEAARAGQHGKGFTVVADQVRTLAGRSQDAAKNTTELIESTLNKVGDGIKIADQTAEALEKIVIGINDISGLVNEIAVSSNEQSQGIDQINIGISQISEVTQTNTATSEEEAAFAEQLSSQAETFRNMVNRFKLKQKN